MWVLLAGGGLVLGHLSSGAWVVTDLGRHSGQQVGRNGRVKGLEQG